MRKKKGKLSNKDRLPALAGLALVALSTCGSYRAGQRSVQRFNLNVIPIAGVETMGFNQVAERNEVVMVCGSVVSSIPLDGCACEAEKIQ